MDDILITAVTFTGFYYIIKMFTDYLLKRKIVKSGHFDKVEILDYPRSTQKEELEPKRFSSLKYALLSVMGGLGLITSELIGKFYHLDRYALKNSFITYGIMLLFIGIGFISYFIIVSSIIKQPSKSDS